MPSLRRPAQRLLTACLAGAILLGVAPTPASALEPPRPLPAHRPVFVTQTDVRPWDDCLWASASMLLDKWTNGDLRISHGRLRRLSGDMVGGSSFEDMRVAFRRLGFAVPLDANGSSTLTWRGLLARLKAGAGAVVLGDYGNLPRWYGRWDYRFWKGKGSTGSDDHAVYVERYDARRGRVWIMDPLGRDGYSGEWISIWSLYRFAWIRAGRVQAITTPTAKPAPFGGVTVGEPEIGLSPVALTAIWPLRAPRRWRFQGADVRVSADRASDPLVAASRSALAVPAVTSDPAPQRPSVRVDNRDLRVSTALPSDPGAWTVALRLTDRRFGRHVASTEPLTAFVPGPRRATLSLHEGERRPDAGDVVRISLTVANTGDVSWLDIDRADAEGRAAQRRQTRLVATWILLDEPQADGRSKRDAKADRADGADADVVDKPLVVELRQVPLSIGETVRVRAEVPTPAAPGRWALVIDIVDAIDGSFAALGSAPAVGLFEVLPATLSDLGGQAVD